MSYQGPERRQPNDELARLTAEAGAKLSALGDMKEEVSYTRRAVGQLTEALTVLDAEISKAPSLADIAEAKLIISRQLKITGVMLAVLLVLILIANFFFVGGLNAHMDEGHTRITCLLKVPAEQRTDDYVTACGVR